MEITFGSRLKHAWNAFFNKDPTYNMGLGYTYRPDRPRFTRGNEKTIVTAVYNRIAMDAAAINIQHVRLDKNGRFLDVINSGLNNCLTLEANTDQTGRAFIQDAVMSMLDEEIARAIIVGDGRSTADDDKINESNIRPIWTDDDLYTIKTTVSPSEDTDDARAKAFIRACVKSRKDYKGSGTPTLYTTEDVLTDCLLMEDGMGRVIYESVDKLATALRVKEIVTVPVLENLTRTNSDGDTVELMGIIVNLADYNVGADKGGAVNMFDDFDIDYNAQKYLIETRCSGALIKPYSAIALEIAASTAD